MESDLTNVAAQLKLLGMGLKREARRLEFLLDCDETEISQKDRKMLSKILKELKRDFP